MSETSETKSSTTVVRMRYNIMDLSEKSGIANTLSSMTRTIDGNTILPLPWDTLGPVLITLSVENAPCRYSLVRLKKESTGGLFGSEKTRVESLGLSTDARYSLTFDPSLSQDRRADVRRLIEPDASEFPVPEVFASLLHDSGIVTLGEKNRDFAIQFDGQLSYDHVRKLCIRTVVANAWVSENSKTGAQGHWAFQ